METLDSLVTYAYDLTLGGGAFYIGGSLILYLTKRWQQLEPRSKTAIQIPLALKAQQTEALALELEPPASKLEMAEPLPASQIAAPAELEILEDAD
ncbi:MAG: hypothetical protein KME07_07940 [Pegethrix bostrychoides GSE-TBD4-15B]|jgi:hypothetical protein|uniref:Uncharacterized protein n=1 Tax=Pegethrix bostrychoides GSE-TBD4-15B TaxID=2839662 RepID=A0A951P994_9CYAN|nr:hypothetical protein [Pegethrix bostrychoides GSE-TBD4-15B]